MQLSAGLAALLLVSVPSVIAQINNLPNLSTLSVPDGQGATNAASSNQPQQTQSNNRQSAQSSAGARSTDAPQSSGGSSPTSNNAFPTVTQPNGVVHISNLPTLAGIGVPQMQVPDTAAAPFMQKSDLPDGTVFIAVGSILAFFAFAVFVWRGMVAWSLHRSVQRAAMAQNLADMKAMSAVPGKKRGMYNVVGANSTMSLDHLSAAPIGTSRSNKPFAQAPGGTPPPKSASSLFFSPTAGNTGYRDSMNRSSTYLPAGYYASGNAAPASGSPVTHVGGHGHNMSMHSLATPGNRYSTRSGISPPGSPSLAPSSRGFDRAPPSRDGLSLYNRNSVATLGRENTRSGVYGQGNDNVSQLSLNVPGGTSVAGGRAPSAYLEDLFENHGNGPRERF